MTRSDFLHKAEPLVVHPIGQRIELEATNNVRGKLMGWRGKGEAMVRVDGEDLLCQIDVVVIAIRSRDWAHGKVKVGQSVIDLIKRMNPDVDLTQYEVINGQ